LAGALVVHGPALAAAQPGGGAGSVAVVPLEAELLSSAPVVIDGQVLFRVRGVSVFPAPVGAAAIAGRIEALAK
jgi:hypothetical protein